MRSEPKFIDINGVLRLHQSSIAKFGGTLGIRDRGTLESAVMHPEHVWHYGGTHYDVAAAYAYHIAEGQCFLDGNKRTAAAAAITFLRLNGIVLRFDDLELHRLLIAVANREANKQHLAEFFRTHTHG